MLQPDRDDRIAGDGTHQHGDGSGNHTSAAAEGPGGPVSTGQGEPERDRRPDRSGPAKRPRQGRFPTGARTGHAGGALPVGFRLVAATLVLVGLAALWAGLQVFVGASAFSGIGGGLSRSLSLVGFLSLCLGSVHVAAGYGTWRGADWGRRLALLVAVFGILGNGVFLVQAGAVALTGLALYGGMAWYLHHNEARYPACHATAPPSPP